MMRVTLLPSFTDNYIFILEDPQTSSFIAVDPGDPTVVMDYARTHQKTLSDILVTHHHWDHTDGITPLKDAYPACRVWTPSNDPKRFSWSTNLAKPGTSVSIGGIDWTILALPGHTYDHIGYWDPAKKRLFAGDTIFNIGCGRVFDGSLENLYESLLQIKSLPADTMVYCAHEYTLANIEFAKKYMQGAEITNYQQNMQLLRTQQKPTVPFELSTNLNINPFLTAEDLTSFSARRLAKDKS